MKRHLTRKESAKLLKLGIPAESASKVYWEVVTDSKGNPLTRDELKKNKPWLKGYSEKPFSTMIVGLMKIDKEDIFSRDDLIDMLPTSFSVGDRELFLEMTGREEGGYVVSYDFSNGGSIEYFEADELIDALYRTVMWFCKSGYKDSLRFR